MAICSISGCGKPATKRGWCGAHYRRWRVHGDPMITRKRANCAGYIQNGYRGTQKDGVRKFEHVEIAERALGRPLPSGAVVHHTNGDGLDNRNSNLVICPSRAYHNLLHRRIDAQNACGNPDWRKCRHCGRYDDPLHLRVYQTKANSFAYWHLSCAREKAKRDYWRNKNAAFS